MTEEILPKILHSNLSGPTSADSESSTGAMHVSSSSCMDWRRKRQRILPTHHRLWWTLRPGVDQLLLSLRLQPNDRSNSVVLFLPSSSDLGTFPGNLVPYGARQPNRRRRSINLDSIIIDLLFKLIIRSHLRRNRCRLVVSSCSTSSRHIWETTTNERSYQFSSQIKSILIRWGLEHGDHRPEDDTWTMK